jgi:hypothetical protein
MAPRSARLAFAPNAIVLRIGPQPGAQIRLLARDAERLAQGGTTRDALAAELDALLAKPNTDLTIADIRRIVTMSMLPDELRPASEMVVTRNNLLSTGHVGRAITDPLAAAPFSQNTRVELDDLRLARAATSVIDDATSSPESVSTELQALLAKPEAELTVGDVRRILTLASLPEPLRPLHMEAMPFPQLRAAGRIGSDVVDPTAAAALTRSRNELLRLRIGADRQRVLLDGTSPADLERELRTMLAGSDDLTPEQLHRLAVLDGLPAEARPNLPSISYDPTSLAERIAKGTSAANLRRDVNSIRLSLEAAEEATRNPRTREQLTDELAHILVRPNSQIDADALRRMAVIARLPAEVRPELAPLTSHGYDLPRVWLDNVATNAYGTTALDAARRVVIRNSALGLDELVAAARNEAGTIELDKLAPALRETVVGAGTEQLERLGINDRMLLAGALGSARDGRVKSEVEAATREAHAIAAKLEPRNDVERVILDKLRAQLEHSLGRIEHRVRGGYSNYVDYQNHGGAIANADLLLRMDEAARAQSSSAARISDDVAVEALTW